MLRFFVYFNTFSVSTFLVVTHLGNLLSHSAKPFSPSIHVSLSEPTIFMSSFLHVIEHRAPAMPISNVVTQSRPRLIFIFFEGCAIFGHCEESRNTVGRSSFCVYVFYFRIILSNYALNKKWRVNDLFFEIYIISSKNDYFGK